MRTLDIRKILLIIVKVIPALVITEFLPFPFGNKGISTKLTWY
jgi:hypothetical protein